MAKRMVSVLKCGLVAVGVAWFGMRAVAVEFIYPSEHLVVAGETFADLMQTRSTGSWTWQDYPKFNNNKPVYFFERRKGRTLVSQTIPADTFLFGLRIANVNFAGASEDPCLNDRDYPFLDMTIDELEIRMESDPDLRIWFDGESVEDFDWDQARQELEGRILYPPHTPGACIDPGDTASGEIIEREIGWAGHYFLIPPLDPGVHQFQYFAGGGNLITREFTVLDGLVGDLDRNGSLDAADIDMLSEGIRTGSGDLLLDRDRNRIVNADDRDYWLFESARTYVGDANFDGQFNSDDFVKVFESGEYEDSLPLNSGWASGDWNGDAEFTSDDIVAAFVGGGYNQGPRGPAVAVPEPSGFALVTSLLVLSLAGRRNRSRDGRPY